MFKLSFTCGIFFNLISRLSWDIYNFLDLWIIWNVKKKIESKL